MSMRALVYPTSTKVSTTLSGYNSVKLFRVTKSIKAEQLFRGDTYGHNLSIKQLAQKTVYIIKRADPNEHVHVHQLRKVAMSLNFFK